MHAPGVAEQHAVRQPAGEGLRAGGEQLHHLQLRQRVELLGEDRPGQVTRDPEAGLRGLRRRVLAGQPDADLDPVRRRVEQLEALLAGHQRVAGHGRSLGGPPAGPRPRPG